MDRRTYLDLLRCAGKQSRCNVDAEDLLQTALLFAVEARRSDMTLGGNRRWLVGMLRNRARHEARSAARRRRRESEFASCLDDRLTPIISDGPCVLVLPPALRTTALLAMTGHARAEIACLQNLSDTALRKRISEIRRRWKGTGNSAVLGGPRGSLPFGLIRRALIRRVRLGDAVLGSHDPDGNLFVVTSQIGRPRQLPVSDI